MRPPVPFTVRWHFHKVPRWAMVQPLDVVVGVTTTDTKEGW